ncbi:hypothetical protein E4U41_004667 [Claviceps citrina]|nr:hypothetical protein E4U41_004667 [Claviceps citrina]
MSPAVEGASRTLELGPRGWFSGLSFASVPYSWIDDPELSVMMAPARDRLRDAESLSSCSGVSVAAVRVRDSSCSFRGEQDSAAGVCSSCYAPGTDQSCSASSPGPSEVGRRDDDDEDDDDDDDEEASSGPGSDASLDEVAEQSAGKSKASGIAAGRQGGAKESPSMVGTLSPQAPRKNDRQMPQEKSQYRVDRLRKRRPSWFQFRSNSLVPSLSPAWPEKRQQQQQQQQRESVAGSESSGCCSLHTPASTECPSDTSGRSTSSLQNPLAVASSVTEKDSSRNSSNSKLAARRGAFPHVLTVAIPEGKLFEDKLLDLLSA